jgi:hypothetical protein
MKSHTRIVFAGITAAGAALIGVASAHAAVAPLTDGQLDSVTAGVVVVVASADADAVGFLTRGGTTTTSVVTAGADPHQPYLESGSGLADGVALAVGTNFGQSGPPPSSSSAVNTAGAADGNWNISSTVNHTMRGPGGVSMTVGWTYVFGAWLPL